MKRRRLVWLFPAGVVPTVGLRVLGAADPVASFALFRYRWDRTVVSIRPGGRGTKGKKFIYLNVGSATMSIL